MEIITEKRLRSAKLGKDVKQYRVPAGSFVTPLAREYLKDRGVELVVDDGGDEGPSAPAKKPGGRDVREGAPGSAFTFSPVMENGDRTFIDLATGKGFAEKPERMTHLHGNVLVSKTHPRIAFRGALDTLQGEIILAQTEALEAKLPDLTADLDEILTLSRQALGAEVSGRALSFLGLLGYDASGLREASHDVDRHFGLRHPSPAYDMGPIAARLNLLRAKAREAELAGERAFADGERDDIMLALNRMSSAIYIMLCKFLANKYGR
ncbi:MAG: hypothetical protein LBG71_00765 [Clostridiales Family XIII bacterium]|jgi:ethanolamine utilization cobalamin adenosyltransferase|nr:hypothetical protein [Clostridiales Family XIII bacterium]